MRLARLVAAGLALGALIGFLSALLRPRSIHDHGEEPGDDSSGSEAAHTRGQTSSGGLRPSGGLRWTALDLLVGSGATGTR